MTISCFYYKIRGLQAAAGFLFIQEAARTRGDCRRDASLYCNARQRLIGAAQLSPETLALLAAPPSQYPGTDRGDLALNSMTTAHSTFAPNSLAALCDMLPPLAPYLDDPAVSEIMVNRSGREPDDKGAAA
jgi:hypothetical protein